MASLVPTNAPPAFRITYADADLDANTSTVTLYASADGCTREVRTAINLGASGGFTAFDAEPPFGVPVVYQALQFDVSGNRIGYTDSITGTITTLAPQYAWFSDPLDETSGVQVVMSNTAGVTSARPIPGTIYTIAGKAAALTGVQGPLADVDMSFYAQSADDDAAILTILQNSNGNVLLRTAPGFGILIPRSLYCFAGSASPTYLDGNGALWANTVSEVSPTTQEVTQSKTSWDDVINGFATWDDVTVQFGSWIDLETSFD